MSSNNNIDSKLLSFPCRTLFCACAAGSLRFQVIQPQHANKSFSASFFMQQLHCRAVFTQLQLHASTLPVGSKDLTRVAAQRNQCSRVDCQSCSSGDDSSDSNTQSREKQQSSDALGIESAHNQHEHKDTPGTSPSLQNGGTAQGTVSKIVPSHPANAPPVLDNSHHTPPSLSVVSPDAFSPQQASSSVNEQAIRSTGDQKKACALPYVLFAIDGTWQEAKEIYKVVKLPLLPSVHSTQLHMERITNIDAQVACFFLCYT